MALLLIPPRIQFFDNDGKPLVGGKVYTYQAGTTTPKVTYQDEAATVPNANPVKLDSIRGDALIRLVGSYKIDLYDQNDVHIPNWPVDNVTEYDVRDWSGLTATIAELNATNTSILSKNGDYTTLLSDRGKTILVDATAVSPTTVTLLNATTATNGYQITIKKADKTNNLVHVDAATAQLIDGIDPYVLYDYNDFVKVLSDGSNWHLIAARIRGTLLTLTSTPFTAGLEDEGIFYNVDATSGAFAVNLPAINTLGRGYQISFKKVDSTSNVVTITPNGSETIDGAASLALTDQYESVILKADGNNWFIISEYGAGSSRTTPLPKDYRSGVLLANNAGDTSHDIDFAIGKWRSSDDTTNLVLSALMTKRIDANWVAGTGNGGFPSGLSLTQDTWYHCFLIGKEDGTTDAGFDSDVTAANLLADATGYTKRVRVGTVRTEPTTTNLLQFVMFYIGKYRITYWKDPTLEYEAGAPGTSAILITLKTPVDVNALGIFNFYLDPVGQGVISTYLSNPSQSDLVPSRTVAPLAQLTNELPASQQIELMTNTSSQIRFRLSHSGGSLVVRASTLGWKE